MFRAQFSFGTPPGFKDVPYVRPVTVGQDVNVPIPSGEFYNNYIIPLDNDAPSIFRSLFIQGVQQDQPSQIQMQLRDAFGNFLTDGYIPLDLYAWGAGNTPPDGGSGRAKVFEPELYCPKGSVLIADFYNPGDLTLPLFGTPPVLMESIHEAVNMRNQTPGGGGQAQGIISFGGALYQVLQYVAPPFPAGSINVFKSVDKGLTWNILDSANSPAHSPAHGETQSGVFFDGSHTITVASTIGTVIGGAAAPILLQNFDLSIGIWGAIFGPGSGNVYGVNQCFVRSDGSILVIGIDSIAGGAGSSITAYILTAGVWSSFVLTSSYPGGWVSLCNSATAYDPGTGTVHMFGSATVGFVHHQYYQQLLLTNSVAGFQDMTGVYGPGAPLSNGNPLIVGSKLVYGVPDPTDSYATVLVGSPLAAPVFTIAPSPGVNPAQPIPGYPNSIQPVLATDGVSIWAVFLNSTAETQVWLSVTTDIANPLTGWVGGLVYDDLANIFGADGQYPTIAIINGQPLMTVEAPAPSNQPTNFFLGPSVPAGPVALPPNMELRGIKRYPVRCE